MTTNLQAIPLCKLILGERNVRKTGADGGLDELAASISAHGLLQSLVVQPAKRGKFAVIAGGRRLRALQRLAGDGALAKDFAVPCRLIAADEPAEELSLAENIIRAPMHPADQFEAFCAVIDQGKCVADVAARFSVSEDLVERRLKLGRLSAVILKAFRDEQLDLAQAQAFSLSDDHAAQEHVFVELAAAGQLSARRIRAALTHGEVPSSDKRVRFIGQEAYVRAGGAIRRDLFDEDDDFYVCDESLLERLVTARLAETAESVKAEGWQWVNIDLEADYATFAAYERIAPEAPSPTKRVQKKIDALTAEYDALWEALPAEAGDNDLARLDAIQDAIVALQPEPVWSPEDIATSGAIISLDGEGAVSIERGLMLRAEARKRAQALGDSTVPSAGPYSAKLTEYLTAHKTAALRIEFARQPDLALAAVVHALIIDRAISSCLALQIRSRHLNLDVQTPALQQFEALQESWRQRVPENPEDVWPWCLCQPHDVLLELLAVLAAEGIDAVQPRVIPGHADQLATALQLDMRKWFTPTAADVFARVSRKTILGAIDEAAGSHGPALDALGKHELALRAEQLLGPTKWLPEPLRITLPEVPDMAE